MSYLFQGILFQRFKKRSNDIIRICLVNGAFVIPFFVLSFTDCDNQLDKEIPNKKPNVVFLLADDLGYGELGCYGQQILRTPVLDGLAKRGMRFTDFYAGSPVCSPSRAVLMTGKHSGINTIRGNKGVFANSESRRVALRKDETTLGEMMKGSDYQTAFIGKWHLEDPDDVSTWAHARGFDYAVQEQWSAKNGVMNFDGPMEYINGMQDSINFDWKEWNCMDEYRTSLAFDYLDTKLEKDKPFFLFMSYRAPHGHEKVIGNKTLYAEKGWTEDERRHAAKVTMLDQQIGMLIDKLEELGELDNTLILFTSDNGPHHEGGGHDHEFFNSNGDLKGFKRDLYEGGIRVPFIAYWKGKIEGGIENTHMGSFQDFMPTLADVSGIETPAQSDGISLLPVLLGGTPVQHEYLNWEFFRSGKGGFRQSVRIGDLKGVRYGLGSEIELYDLSTDIKEINDVAAEHPDLFKRMSNIFITERTATDGFPYGGSEARQIEEGENPDLFLVPSDLKNAPVTNGKPEAGKRVKQTLPSFSSTGVHHLLHLPSNWEEGKKYPVIVEYAGNGPWSNAIGDLSTGRVEGCNLGYGISGGRDFILLSLPFISEDGSHNQDMWWGDIESAKRYCMEAVEAVCRNFGGDENALILSGFSRGAIAVNYIGLHDDEISKLWAGFIANSHYDGVKLWGYADDDKVSAKKRLQRLDGRPQFICQEGKGTNETAKYIVNTGIKGNFTFLDIPYRNHTNSWVLHDIPEREVLRKWVSEVIENNETKN